MSTAAPMLLDLIQAAAFVESGAQPTSSHPTSSEPQPRSWLAAAGRARGSHQRRLLCVPVPVLNADDVFSASAASSASATMAISPALARKAFGDIYGGKAFPRRRWRRVSTDGQPQGVDPEVLASALQTAVGTAVGDGAGAGEDVFCMELMGDDGPQDQDDEDEEDGSEARFVSDQQGCIEKQRRAYMNACFARLRDSVPALAGTKASNANILLGAAKAVKELEQEDERLLAAIRVEQKRLAKLRFKIKRLQAACGRGWGRPRIRTVSSSSSNSAMEEERVVPAGTSGSALLPQAPASIQLQATVPCVL